MHVTVIRCGSMPVAVIDSPGILIADEDDALEVMATVAHAYGCDAMVIDKSALTELFFDLKTGLAGAILLKFTNYRFRVAVVGDFDACPGQSLKDFIRESNRGDQFFFVPTKESALARFRALSGTGVDGP